jgi:hypothetical protein
MKSVKQTIEQSGASYVGGNGTTRGISMEESRPDGNKRQPVIHIFTNADDYDIPLIHTHFYNSIL